MPTADLSRKFQEVLATYLEAKERGEAVDPAALLRAYPELAADLNEFFANEKQFASAAAGLANDEPRLRVNSPKIRDGSLIGDYELLDEIARGGMGVVYRARHRSLQRLVALKMLLGGAFAGRDGLRRFRTEAELVAGLDHPHIVPIYDIGTHDGQAFFCMKLIDGPSLKEHAAAFVGKPDAAVRLLIRVARAVHHAHQRGILHRDLKPGNILLQIADAKLQTEKKNKQAGKKDYPISGIPQSAIGNLQSAFPFVTDFGLAKRVEADGKASQSTQVVGTAAYMAPEQATGREALTVAADVYSLGAILYELLAGRPPFVGDNPLEVLLQVVEKDPPSPLELQPRLDPDLAQICLKCLRKSAGERYASAEALAVELEQWLAGDPLSVRAPTRTERFWRWFRRHPFKAVASCLILVLALALAGVSAGGNWYLEDLVSQLQSSNDNLKASEELAKKEEQRAKDAAERERLARLDAEKAKADLLDSTAKEKIAAAAQLQAREAEVKALEEGRRLLVQHYVGNGQQLLQRGDLYGASVWFAEALELDKGDAEREATHRIRLGATVRACPPLTQTWFLDDKPRLLRLSPAGDRLLIVGKTGTASLWDTTTRLRVGEPLRQLGALSAVEFAPNGQWLASAAEKTVRIWDIANAKVVGAALEHKQEVRSLSIHPDGKKLLTLSEDRANKDGELRVWNLATGQSEKSLKIAPAKTALGIRAAGYSRDGKRIFAVTSANKIHLYDAALQSIQTPIAFAKGDVAVSPGVDRYVQMIDNDVRIIELAKSGAVTTLTHDSPVYITQFSPGGRFIASASANGGVRLTRVDTSAPLGPALPHHQKIAALAFSHNEQALATATDDGVVRLWRLAWPERAIVLTLPASKGTLLSVSPDGRHALLAQKSALAIWDFEQGRTVGAAIPLIGTSPLTRFAPDGKSVAIVQAGQVKLWQVPTGKSLAQKTMNDQAFQHLRFSPDGADLIAWGKTHLHVWDSEGNTLLSRDLAKTVHLLDCDGKRIASWKTKDTLEIQERASGKMQSLKLAVLPELFRFSPDRRTGTAVFADGSVRSFDVATGKPMTPVFGAGAPIRRITYNADGAMLAAASATGKIRVWDRAGLPLTPPLALNGSLADFAFRNDSAFLLAWTTDGQLQRWSLRPLEGAPADLRARARLGASQEIHVASGSLVPLDRAALRELSQEIQGLRN